MSPARLRARTKEAVSASASAAAQNTSVPWVEPHSGRRETLTTSSVAAIATSNSSTCQAASKLAVRKVLRLQCPQCSDSPGGFRSEHELRRHHNRVHRKTRKVWVTIDTSPDKTFLAGCKACQTGKRYNECYNAASHLRRMHFHPHKRGDRKMTAAEARRGGKLGDLEPSMDVLKARWLREIDEIISEDNEIVAGHVSPISTTPSPRMLSRPLSAIKTTKTINTIEEKTTSLPNTPSTRSMAIESIVDKMSAS